MIDQRTCHNCGSPYWLRQVTDPLYSKRYCPFCFSRVKVQTPTSKAKRLAIANRHRTVERYPDPAREDDKKEIAAHGGKFRSGYRHIVGDAPMCGPRDLLAAKAFLAKIERALDEATFSESEGGYGLSKTERNRLKRMQEQWGRRARGDDPRFNVVGNRGGRVDADDENRMMWERKMIRIRQMTGSCD